MLTALIVVLRSIGLICRGHRAVALENIALRQQLAALTRTTKRPRLRPCDRFFWIVLARAWRGWRGALLMAQADTVVRWPRQWLRRRWTDRSRQKQSGRPSTVAAIRALIDKMASANPLWGAANPWRVAQAGHRCLGANGLADRREVSATAIPEVAHLPHESPRRDRLNGLLHRAHAHGPRVVRAGPPRAPTSSSRPPGRH